MSPESWLNFAFKFYPEDSTTFAVDLYYFRLATPLAAINIKSSASLIKFELMSSWCNFEDCFTIVLEGSSVFPDF